jgi:hypothetical protein
MSEIKRQIYAVLFVVLLLLLLFNGDFLLGVAHRVHAEISPGGLSVSYYGDTDFKSFVCSRTERSVQKNYGHDRPAFRVPKDGFGSRWEGFLMVPEDGVYRFYIQSEDGSRLVINDELIIDHWGSRSWVPGVGGEAYLEQGQYMIRIEHVDHGGLAAIRLRWAGGPIPPNTVLAVPYIRKR